MSWLSNFVKGGKNPADAAMPYLNQIPGMGQQYYNPFIQQGQSAYQNMQGPLSQMTQDPAKFLEGIMGSYEPSKGFQLKRDEGLRAAGNTAAAGGMRGSLQDIEGESHLADSLMGEDMQQWLNNVMGIQGRGLSGQQDMYNKGFQASGSLADLLGGNMNAQAGLAFQGQNQKNQNNNALFKALAQAFGGLGGFASQDSASLFGNKLWG
ncbi:MAG TPA: hypothetical protein VK625_18275 [Flavitalea sp.]|nr:hypothetical protein [Flavitalea sp.]